MITLTGDATLTFSNHFAGSVMRPLQLIVYQDATGGHSITSWPTEVEWSPDGVVPTLTQTASAKDSFSFTSESASVIDGQQMGRDYG